MGTKEGTKKIKEEYGEDFYVEAGRRGGKISRGGGFTGDPKRAREVGAKGGRNSALKRKASQWDRNILRSQILAELGVGKGEDKA